ncbi:hypothetical protein ACFQ7F_00410 [Streptomyces sp. NPDC056486]
MPRLLAHAERAPAFQRRALELRKTAVAAGDPQLYGTQYAHEPDGSDLRS